MTLQQCYFEFLEKRDEANIFIFPNLENHELMVWSDVFATYTGRPNRNVKSPILLTLLGLRVRVCEKFF